MIMTMNYSENTLSGSHMVVALIRVPNFCRIEAHHANYTHNWDL
jgi:hypothetical protein